MSPKDPLNHLAVNFAREYHNDAFTTIPYEIGSSFLWYLEECKAIYASFFYLTCVFKVPQEGRTFLIWHCGEGVIWIHPSEVDNEGGEGVLGGHDLIHLVRQVLPSAHGLKQEFTAKQMIKLAK